MAINYELTYVGQADPADAEYPFGKVRNDVVPGDNSGTPLDEAWGLDMSGYHAAAMRQAGITAVSNAPDKVGSSEILQGLARHMSGGATFMQDSGAADAYVLAPPGSVPTRFEASNVLFDGMTVDFYASAGNATTTPTAAMNGTTAKTIVREDGTALVIGDIDAVIMNRIQYNSGLDKHVLLRGVVTETPITRDFIILRDQKTNGTVSGTFTSGARRTRDLTLEALDTGNHCTLAANQFTLAAGTYNYRHNVQAHKVDGHKSWLRNISDSVDVAVSNVGFSDASFSLNIASLVETQFTIAAVKTFEIQHICQSTQITSGFGTTAVGLTDVEIYSQVWMEKVG